jgi:hypothetical protein
LGCIFRMNFISMKRHFRALLLFTFVINLLQAQNYIYNYQIPFTHNGRTLKYPLAGGLNNPQFSAADINVDGKKDIYVFDRSGNKSIILLNEGEAGTINYDYWQQFETNFPDLFDWAILLDYNCDGLEDIITGFDNGIKTFLASSDGSKLTFTEDIDKLEFTEVGFTFFIAVGVIDVPGFADINFDGDIDLLTFNMAGGIVDYYENRQIENGLPCGSWALEHVNSCWGNFYESGLEYAVDLDYDCKGVTSGGNNNVHAGSSFMIFDEDADNDMDIVLGDLAFNNLNKLVNGGDNTFAQITAQDTTFPEYDKPYDDPIFPSPYLIDVDGDGKKDMLVSPNNVNQSENLNNVWYYKNVSEDDTYVFDYIQDSLFVSEMIDLGSGAYPAVFDYNYDNLPDLVIGNNGYFETGDYKGMLALYENTGTATQPEFTLITRDLAGISDFDFNWLTPTFGDLDGDGDKDLLLGESEGFLHYFKNIGPPDGPASFVLQAGNYQGIDVGKNSAPQLIDIDNDGLDDLIIGETNGNLNFYRNTGTAAAPVFTLESDFWGNVDVRAPLAVQGSSVPFLYKNVAGIYELYVGCEDGTIYQYLPTTDFTGAFTEVTDQFNNIDEGGFSSVCLFDLNSDTYPDLITGNLRGGITMYRDENTAVVEHPFINNKIHVYPNPGNGIFTIAAQTQQLLGSADVMGIDGKWFTTITLQDNTTTLNISDLPAGIYFIRLKNEEGIYIQTIQYIKM